MLLKAFLQQLLLLAIINSSSSQPQCGTHQFYSGCGTACPLICGEEPPEICILVCVDGCFCEEGYCLDENGDCKEKIPQFSLGNTVAQSDSPTVSPSSSSSPTMACGLNQVYSDCGTACPARCAESLPLTCVPICMEGCFCEEGYCLDENEDCVPCSIILNCVFCNTEKHFLGRIKSILNRFYLLP